MRIPMFLIFYDFARYQNWEKEKCQHLLALKHYKYSILKNPYPELRLKHRIMVIRQAAWKIRKRFWLTICEKRGSYPSSYPPQIQIPCPIGHPLWKLSITQNSINIFMALINQKIFKNQEYKHFYSSVLRYISWS